MQMGSLDWVHPDSHNSQVMQGIRFVTAMGLRIYERVRVMEREVHLSQL